MRDLADLIERLEKATGPDRELDAWIGYHTDLYADDLSWRDKIDRLGIDHAVAAATSYSNIWRTQLPSYTASIDAAVALVERLYPDEDAVWNVMTDFGGLRRAHLHISPNSWVPSGGKPGLNFQADGATPAIALCLALLRAKQAETPQ